MIDDSYHFFNQGMFRYLLDYPWWLMCPVKKNNIDVRLVLENTQSHLANDLTDQDDFLPNQVH
jgi:hypothetical protein